MRVLDVLQGHTFCTSCWQSWFVRGNRSCPSCRGKPLNAEPVINRYLSGVIDRLQVRCECGHEFSANHLQTHRDEECALRLLDCPLQCGWQGPFSSLRDHMPDQCSMMFTVCPHEGCGMIVRRADLNKHKPHCRPLPQGEAETGEGQRGTPAAAILHVSFTPLLAATHTALDSQRIIGTLEHTIKGWRPTGVG